MLKAFAIGRVSQDAQVVTSPKTGKKFVTFQMAVNKSRDVTEYIKVTTGVEKLAQYLKKGVQLL